MKKTQAIAAAIAAALLALNTGAYKTQAQETQEAQAQEAQVPEGFRNWQRTAFVFKDSSCIRISRYKSEAKMYFGLRLKEGERMVVVTSDKKNGISFTPSKPGQDAKSYKLAMSTPDSQIWYASADGSNFDKNALKYTPLTSRINLSFEFVPENLDSLTFDLPASYDGWSPFTQTGTLRDSGRRHICLTPEQMKEGQSFTVLPMVNSNSEDSELLRTQIPLTFHYRDIYKPGVIPFKSKLSSAQTLDAKFTDSHEKFFDNEYNLEYTLKNQITSEEKRGKMPVSLWTIKRNYEVASDTTDFRMNIGANFAFWFGSQGVNAGWYDSKTDFGSFRKYSVKKAEHWAKLGFDFYRIPIDEGWCFFSDGTLKPDCEAKLKAFVDEAIKNGVRVIIDLHWLAKTQVLPDPEQEIRFRKCWEILHDVFGEYDPEYLAYELLNEATGLDGFWNTFLAYNIGMIRSWGGKEVRRPIVCANEEYMAIDDFHKLQLPSDPNLIASFHDYSPILFCFYTTGFVGGIEYDKYTGPIHYPGLLVTYEELEYMKEHEPKNYEIALNMKGESWDRESLYEHMKKALPTGKRLNLPVLVGEYGAFCGTPKIGSAYKDRLQYFHDAAWAFSKLGFAFSYWFSLSKDGADEDAYPEQEMVDAIMSGARSAREE